MLGFFLILALLLVPAPSRAKTCLKGLEATDSLILSSPQGRIICKQNATKKRVPASTLKILTALSAIEFLGPSYRFPTEFYMDPDRNLKVKGYGDPLLISEVWAEIASELFKRVPQFKGLVLDDSFFGGDITIPGQSRSTNPYDAPVGALCANFNTVFFMRDEQGRIISAEPQTPLLPFAREKIQPLGLEKGRYTFSHDRREAAVYAGRLLMYYLKREGAPGRGKTSLGKISTQDRLIYTYRSRFTLEEVVRKMMEFSNNFIANQIFISLGAHVYGPPGTLAKGVRAVHEFSSGLGLKDITIVEGSGISRKNRLSAMDMLIILQRFRPHRHLLSSHKGCLYKTGTLRGIRTRAGYIKGNDEGPSYFAVFINRGGFDMDRLMTRLKGCFSSRTSSKPIP